MTTTHPGTLTPFAAAVTRVAKLINDEDLPEAHVTISSTIVTVSASTCELPENVVRRWAQALGLIVDERPYDWDSTAATLLTAGGILDGVCWQVHAIVPLSVTA